MLQALLDVYTIDREIGKLDGIKVALVGDLANGRTVRSLAYLLAKYQDVKIYFVSPDVVKMKVIELTPPPPPPPQKKKRKKIIINKY
jgi:aspartate carbamoyltransferase catalytic subunit